MNRPVRAALAMLLGATAVPAAAQAPAEPARDLTSAFTPGWLIDDRNGDDVIDFVDARIVIPASPSPADVAAAANVAARLGWETSALDLGLLDREDAGPWDVPVIVIGGATDGELGPGEGAVSVVAADARFRAGGLRITGGDATGLLAAAAYLSGRYPNLWSVDGDTWSDAAERLREILIEVDSAAVDSVRVRRIVVDAARPGISRATLLGALADTTALREAGTRLAGSARDTAAEPADSTRERRSEPERLEFAGVRRFDVHLVAPGAADTVRVRPREPRAIAAGAPWPARDASDFTLSDIFTIRGLYRDTNQDLVPDRTEAHISLAGADAPDAVVDLAARIALETAGARLPLVHLDPQDDTPERLGIPIVAGTDHFQVRRLRSEERLGAGGTQPGEGIVELVPNGFDGKHGLVVTGADSAGVDAAASWLARRAPYLWTYGKGEYRLADVETEVRRFFQARKAPGQVALAATKLRSWLERIGDLDIDSIAVEIAAAERPDGLDAHARSIVANVFPGAAIVVRTFKTGFGVGDTVFTQQLALPWEVDTVRHALEEALPRIPAGSTGRIEVRVSEPPEVRAALADAIRAGLRERGMPEDAFDVVVLSAYKQGYSWLHDEVLPKLRNRDIGAIEIAYHSLRDSDEVRWQTIASETRWLQEIYPIDAVFARELGIPDSVITFTPRRNAQPIYTVRVLDPDGGTILTESFDPRYVVRPFFDLFPEYENVRVTTGSVRIVTNGDTLLDRRVRTDAEAFWDILQTDTYARIIEYVMDIQDGRPSPSNAPFFDELRVDLSLSEPDYRIGVDEEVISSLEALHEDIYFETLTLFDLIGNRWDVGGLSYPGRVLPWIHRMPEPGPGHARITFTGKQRGVPELVFTYRERGRDPVRMRYPLSPLDGDPPMLRGVALRAGQDGLARMLFDVIAVDSLDRTDELRDRATEAAIDRQLLPVPLLMGMVESLGALHDDGLFLEALSLDRVGELAFRFVLDGDTTAAFQRTARLARTSAPRSTRNPVLLAEGWQWGGERIVQWDTPIPPAESDSILAHLATFPTANVYFLLKSFLGQNTFAVDFLPPHDATYISQAKLNALKPTLLLSGRQHANEVSSTSHILRLGELLATDSSYQRLLRDVNVVLHPITNPDGAQIAYEMQLENPDFMLHAGYLGALGVDATAGAGSDDPIYPESQARPRLLETWLPDISMNLHGYPSHEWVQYFAGYSAWVRSRTGTQRSWWAPRGWFVPGFSWVDDPQHPEYREAQFAVLDTIAAAITGNDAVEAMNRRMYARYAKYGRQDREEFREYFHNGILIYQSLRGRESIGTGVNSPRITWFATTTEAPDETARGEWLELVASAGLAHTSALLRYLASGQNRVTREADEYAGAVVRRVFRKKPVLP